MLVMTGPVVSSTMKVWYCTLMTPTSMLRARWR